MERLKQEEADAELARRLAAEAEEEARTERGDGDFNDSGAEEVAEADDDEGAGGAIGGSSIGMTFRNGGGYRSESMSLSDDKSDYVSLSDVDEY